MEFLWDDANRGHIAERVVGPHEAEQVLLNEPFDVAVQIRNGEERTIQVGETDAGRILVVITTWRREKLRVVTAFSANKKLRKLYAQFQRESQGGGAEDS